MDTTLFVCPLAPILADAATRLFNNFADPQKARAITGKDARGKRLRLVIALGSTADLAVPPSDERVDWLLFDPRNVRKNNERAHLEKLSREVTKLVESKGWLRAPHDGSVKAK